MFALDMTLVRLFVRKLSITKFTPILHQACVHAHMAFKIVSIEEALIAERTEVVVTATVLAQVQLQVAL